MWTGSNKFGSVDHSTTTTQTVYIGTVGTYLVRWRSLIAVGNDNTEHNDSWLKINGAKFFGEKGNGHKVYPRGGCCGGPYPHGSSDDGFLKVYQNDPSGWNWKTATSDHDAHYVLVTFTSPGIYDVDVSARSYGHAIDRIVLQYISDYGSKSIETIVGNVASGMQDLSLGETRC